MYKLPKSSPIDSNLTEAEDNTTGLFVTKCRLQNEAQEGKEEVTQGHERRSQWLVKDRVKVLNEGWVNLSTRKKENRLLAPADYLGRLVGSSDFYFLIDVCVFLVGNIKKFLMPCSHLLILQNGGKNLIGL